MKGINIAILITSMIAIFTIGQALAGAGPAGFKYFPKNIGPIGERTFYFSPRLKQWAAYDADGQRRAGGRANGGATRCSDQNRACKTPGGNFRIVRKGTANCKSSKYPLGRGGAAMPYCMFFHSAGYAIHGSPRIGSRNTSHGCVRVTTQAAAWLHGNFLNHGTRVRVLSY